MHLFPKSETDSILDIRSDIKDFPKTVLDNLYTNVFITQIQ